MTTPNPTSDFHTYRDSHARYVNFADTAKGILEEAVGRHRPKLPHKAVSGRAKEPISLFRKMLLKARDPESKYSLRGFEAIEDLVGVRVVVASEEDAEVVVDIVSSVFDAVPGTIDRKSLTNEPDELRYLGIHITCRLRAEQREKVDLDLAELPFEVQIHTLAQTAWAVVSHPMVYKPYGTLSRGVAKRVYRAVALVSLFDSEIDEAMKAQRLTDDHLAVEMLKVVEDLFVPWLNGPTDDGLSLLLLDGVKAAYGEPLSLDMFRETLTDWTSQHTAVVTTVVEQTIPDIQPILNQPEILVLLERLDRSKNQLRHAWAESGLDPELLHAVADAAGYPFMT